MMEKVKVSYKNKKGSSAGQYKKKNLPADQSQKAQLNFFSFWVDQLYHKKKILAKEANSLYFQEDNYNFKFYIDERKQFSGLKSQFFLIQLKPFKKYISSLYPLEDGYFLEFKGNIFTLRYFDDSHMLLEYCFKDSLSNENDLLRIKTKILDLGETL